MNQPKSQSVRDSTAPLQRAARERADDEARRIPWHRLLETQNRYIKWREFYLWGRSILEVEDVIPDWLVEILSARVPGFVETDRALSPEAASDCYRFDLTNPAVDVCLTGPRSAADLTAALDALDKGPMTPEEMDWMRRVGQPSAQAKSVLHQRLTAQGILMPLVQNYLFPAMGLASWPIGGRFRGMSKRPSGASPLLRGLHGWF